MMRTFLTVYFLFSSTLLRSQIAANDSIVAHTETINIEEVRVSANLPLNSNNIVDFYRTNHFATLDNIYARLDGMSLIRRGAYAQEPQLNGFMGGQLNITIDGMKMFGACTDRMDPITSYIEPSNLKKISIKPGSTGCANGCSIGGTIDMNLKEPAVNGPGALYSSLAIGHETVSKSKNVLFSTESSTSKWAFGLDAVYRKNENYMDGHKKIIPFSQFQKVNIHSALKYQIDSIRYIKFDCIYDDARNVGYPALPMDVSIAKATFLAWEYQRNLKAQLKVKIYFNNILHVMDDSKRDSLYLIKNKINGLWDSVYMHMDMPGKSATLGGYIQFIIPWNNKNKIVIKADNYTNRSVAEMTMYMRYAGLPPEKPMYMQTWPEMLRNVTGIFIQNTTSISNKFQLEVEGRIDNNFDILQSEYGQKQLLIFNYALSRWQYKLLKAIHVNNRYQLNKHMTTVTSIGYSERMPTISERLGFYLYNAYDGYDYIGNPYLNAERSNFLQVTFLLSQPRLSINFNQSISLISNYIMGVTESTIPVMNVYARGIKVYKNIPNALLLSTGLQVFYVPVDFLQFFVTSKYTFGEIGSGEPMPLIPPFNTIWAVRLQKNKWMLQAECEYTSAQKRVNLNYGEKQTPSYTLFNFKSSYTIKIKHNSIDTSIGVTNIFNRVYYAHLDWGKIHRPGRSFEFYVKYAFNRGRN
ncbi:MAG: TonB-dependent receptor [Bacteroidales bacterium]